RAGVDAAVVGRGGDRPAGGADVVDGPGPRARAGRPVGGDVRGAAVAGAVAGHARAGPGERAARRAVAARVPQAAGRAAAGRAEPRPGSARRARWGLNAAADLERAGQRGCLMCPSPSATLASVTMTLSELDRAVLAFERSWWTEPGAKDDGIRERLGLDPD